MKNILIILCIVFASNTSIKAQCNLEPSILQNNIILCPDKTDTLWTQEYDAYQWYQNGVLMPAETLQYLVVNYHDHITNYFSVSVRENTCVDTSESVLVDGWGFLPPAVQSAGKYIFDGNIMANLVCLGDTIHFKLLGSEYINIVWTKNNIPIPNATTVDLYLTSAEVTDVDVYHVSASTTICPDYVMGLGVGLNVKFVQCITGIGADVLDRIEIFPNPFSDYTNLQVDESIDIRSIKIFTSRGQLLRAIENINSRDFRLERTDLNAGIYFLELVLKNNKIVHEKIIIQD